MQDKIQEIMVLVDAAIMGAEGHEATDVVRDAIESKLRELVREPLAHELAWAIAVVSDSPLDAIRKAEHAHGITNNSN